MPPRTPTCARTPSTEVARRRALVQHPLQRAARHELEDERGTRSSQHYLSQRGHDVRVRKVQSDLRLLAQPQQLSLVHVTRAAERFDGDAFSVESAQQKTSEYPPLPMPGACCQKSQGVRARASCLPNLWQRQSPLPSRSHRDLYGPTSRYSNAASYCGVCIRIASPPRALYI